MTNEREEIKLDIVDDTSGEKLEEITDSVEETNTPEDRHTIQDAMSNIKDVDPDNLSPGVTTPTAKNSVINKLLETIYELDQDKFNDLFTREDVVASSINNESIKLGLLGDVYYERINEDRDNFVNDIRYGDKKYNQATVNIKGKGKAKGVAGLARLRKKMGVGATVQIPLWHSGIWVTIKPPMNKDLINLEIEIAKNQIELGRDTNTLIYSNYSVVFNRIITNFILDHIVATTVDIDPNEDIRDIIKQQDLNILILGMISAMHHDGYDVNIACCNSTVLENDRPKCNHSINAKLNPKYLLRVDRKYLNKKALEHMSMRRPNSVKMQDIIEYQESLHCNKPEVYTIDKNGVKVDIKFKIPTIGAYIDNGELWVEDIITRTEDVFTEADTTEIKNKKINDALLAVVLGIYNVFVDEITDEDTSISASDGINNINEALEILSANEDILSEFIEKVKKYISTHAMAIVATPNYICSKCNEPQSKVEQGAFKDLVPLNVLENFFVLSAQKVRKVKSLGTY